MLQIIKMALLGFGGPRSCQRKRQTHCLEVMVEKNAKASSVPLLFLLFSTGRRVFNWKWQNKTKPKNKNKQPPPPNLNNNKNKEQEPMPGIWKITAISEDPLYAKPISVFQSNPNNNSEK